MKSDAKIQQDVMQELKWDPSVQHEHIGVAVSDGVVTLSGSVPTYIEKSAAEKATQRVTGVKAVAEKIEVKPLGSYMRDDTDIAKAVLAQFKWNVQVPESLVKVSVENGWVTLSGQVEWQYQRRAAEKAVRGLSGVTGLSNQISMKPVLQPKNIKQEIEDALKREAKREADGISVVVDGSTVTLSGDVHSLTELREAKWAAWCAPGVATVHSNLHVTH
jgi:osmotically-inducible protein OsmY